MKKATVLFAQKEFLIYNMTSSHTIQSVIVLLISNWSHAARLSLQFEITRGPITPLSYTSLGPIAITNCS